MLNDCAQSPPNYTLIFFCLFVLLKDSCAEVGNHFVVMYAIGGGEDLKNSQTTHLCNYQEQH